MELETLILRERSRSITAEKIERKRLTSKKIAVRSKKPIADREKKDGGGRKSTN